ncbi:hypothetical protein EMIHUDRAFT_219073 [Emiliania huxleyi CCMP1516]|uniref:RNase H type-1 domain-containing protein n=2 Tax=Emiliania huxleyi TaxID=2903 RepID=A0A0D3I5N1_EMIH1|nr:hypothetical protein EMIHUDRAFT_219073 [Emiliania huxleyi CCMP1516]EOD06566.1 hypothetical protein EMIHUDRAFT_219073 [Emiliania huxleyi CCMP1516]|eukprot:XP_005758995.1 hypothetical protein EMIHUDRAFT_219073 [Emiliania huxleyi CCMP1516]
MTSRTAVSVNRIRSLRPSTVFVDVCPRDTHTPHGLFCFYGEQLQGSAVLVEGDNTAAIGAAQNQASTAVSMQETLRRLLETAERWDIELRFVHTPGVLLHRPDQTSRGDPIEEPRVRLAAAEFAAIERLTGRFTEFVGAERRHAAAEVGAQHKCPGGGSPQSPGGEDGCFGGGLAATVAGGKPPPHLWAGLDCFAIFQYWDAMPSMMALRPGGRG